jgi:hypothetical protein
MDSPTQVIKGLNKLGVLVTTTDVKELSRYKNHPAVKALLEYRKFEKFVTTYGDALMNRIHKSTGRLHTNFTQMVDTGRLSSSNPNLQNIPKEQMYRECFVAKPGYKLITVDMSQAELRILADYSRDPVFLEAYKTGQDLHIRTAMDVFNKTLEEIKQDESYKKSGSAKYMGYRNKTKAVNFGLMYGLTSVGLSIRLETSEAEAQDLIDRYFAKYKKVKQWLDNTARDAVRNRYSTTISGRRRYYRLPPPNDVTFKRIKGSVERAAKNHPIQGCVGSSTMVRGVGRIDQLVGKEISNFETGMGVNDAVGVYSGKKQLCKVKMSNGVVLDITLDHKIPIIRKLMILDRPVMDIDIDHDLLLVPLQIIEGVQSDVSGYKYTKGHWRETYVDYKYPSVMNDKLAFIIGCLIGDGNYSKHNNFSFVCSEDSIELFNKFNQCVEDVFGYKPVVDKVKKKKSVLWKSQISSVVLRGFLRHVGLEYVIKHDKSVPDLFFTDTVLNRGSLLNGLFSTDGGVTKQSGPNFTTVSKQLANDVHQLLFSLGINSNLKTYTEDASVVYRLQIPKRFIEKFVKYVGMSVNRKKALLLKEQLVFNGKDNSLVPVGIPMRIFDSIRSSSVFNTLTSNQKAHLFRLKKGKSSFTSWRKFLNLMPEGLLKKYLSVFLDYDFCRIVSIDEKVVESDAYDVVCKRSNHYFTANGVLVHNSNADVIKQACIYIVDRLKNYDARLILSVHDEAVIECHEDQIKDVKPIVEKCIIDGFSEFFHTVPMETDGLVGDCWLKG